MESGHSTPIGAGVRSRNWLSRGEVICVGRANIDHSCGEEECSLRLAVKLEVVSQAGPRL